MTEKFIEITKEHVALIESLIETAIQYDKKMEHKRDLRITGEVGEIKACFKYGLRLAKNSQSPGYDAIDSDGKKVQIKTRRIGLGKKPTKITSFSEHGFDYCLLLILDENYNINEVWKAESSKLEQDIRKQIDNQLTISSFKHIGTNIFDKNTLD